MLSEHGTNVDRDAVEEVLSKADVLVIGFTLFPQRLLIDTRTSHETGPLVEVVEPLRGVQERFHWLGKHRGMFGIPEAFSFFAWPQTVRTMEERDVLATMRDRLEASWAGSGEQLDHALAELHEMEREAFRQAVAGDGAWKTLWQASRTG